MYLTATSDIYNVEYLNDMQGPNLINNSNEISDGRIVSIERKGKQERKDTSSQEDLTFRLSIFFVTSF